ncbi:putative ferritin [Paratrimastix pyriformis]|uniref:Ferritin n=1 Tax=Paratrimastix pyriformis TaxID=342808 RepID=A0ABQ8UNJ1_9EUKA|nr:putative ferritin [Paratrimastix pyriformis]
MQQNQLSEAMEERLGRQVAEEYWTEQFYISMSNEAEHQNMHGMSKWLRQEAEDEHMHGRKLADYILARGNHVKLPHLRPIPSQWESLEKMFVELAENERRVTEAYNTHIDACVAERDHATCAFLRFYVLNQVEELQVARDILFRFSLIRNAPYMIMTVDRYFYELAARKK